MAESCLPALHAGTCYPNTARAATGFFQQALEPRLANTPGLDFTHPEFLVVPHIDFRVDLDHYAMAYARLWNASRPPVRILILGVGHRNSEEFSCLPLGSQTPWGNLPPDGEAWTLLQQCCPRQLDGPADGYLGEHSIEFAAVWLEFIRRHRFPGSRWRILPVLCGGMQEHLGENRPPAAGDPWFEYGEAIATWLSLEPSSPTLVILSIDGCHVGPRFGHAFDAVRPIRHAVARWEHELWRRCHSRTWDGFFAHLAAVNNGFHFDGAGVLGLLLPHLGLRAEIDSTRLWHEDHDRSFVSFSSGCLRPV